MMIKSDPMAEFELLLREAKHMNSENKADKTKENSKTNFHIHLVQFLEAFNDNIYFYFISERDNVRKILFSIKIK